MKEFIITQKTTWLESFKVKADTKEEALQKFNAQPWRYDEWQNNCLDSELYSIEETK